jgi:hypothetical protein
MREQEEIRARLIENIQKLQTANKHDDIGLDKIRERINTLLWVLE